MSQCQSPLRTKYGSFFPTNVYIERVKIYRLCKLHALPPKPQGPEVWVCFQHVGADAIISMETQKCLMTFHTVPAGSLSLSAFFPNNLGISKSRIIFRWISSCSMQFHLSIWGAIDKPGLLNIPSKPRRMPRPRHYALWTDCVRGACLPPPALHLGKPGETEGRASRPLRNPATMPPF